ncbi:MAG: bifunctional (p)ppGpp synthetase/guanosine-3',5'-bis(diphosphate) 3'-pyrophosphohydrolase [Mariprofundaceae bacterium]|nr:bifunctional (p)ppGpp synthetase/guanosine-3',5'-bis(diphosphate) 3'-pyrophosphohydrolase [Mariprofundaceae bacterium]
MSRIFEITEKIHSYAPKADVDLVNRAYVFAAQAHAEQRRSSGELYITHPLAVASILADLRLDTSSIATGLLHDTVEDTHITLADIEERFGSDIAHLVNGMTKIGQFHFESSDHKKAENFRKMIIATAQDLRVLLVKLADRMHNMRTLGFVSKEKAKRVSQETRELYIPLAHRLGIHWIKQEMEDIAFSYIEPESHQHIVELLKDKLEFFQDTQDKIEHLLQEAVARQGFQAQVQGRMKHLYSLHEKMQHKQISFDKIYDIVAFRLIVDDSSTCYQALGVIHGLYRPIPGRFKDYIALPKPNGYQSLHTSVIGPENHRIEVQIRSQAMHQHAEDGIAAHWLYKDKNSNPEEHQRLLWIKQLTELLQEADNPSEFMESVRLDLFVQEVYVFSRDGEIYALPRGARPLDFAYAVHTDLGYHCIGARINGVMGDLQTKLRNGDQIEILTSPDQEPSRTWLRYVKTSKARQAIRHYYRCQDTYISRRMGQKMIKQVMAHSPSDKMIGELGCQNLEDLEMKLGQGVLNIDALFNAMEGKQGQFLSLHTHNYVHYGAACCYPIPGDAVLGRIIKKRGMELHYRDCPHVLQAPNQAWLDVDWKSNSDRLYPTAIEIYTEDLRGMLAKVTGVIANAEANINDLNLDQRAGEMTRIRALISVHDRIHLAKVLREIRWLDGVVKVKRRQHKELTASRSHNITDTVRGMIAKGRRTLLKSTHKIRGKSS